MEVKVRNEKTYCIEASEHRARDLLNIACTYSDWVKEFPDVELTGEQKSQRETIDILRQILLHAGLKKEPK